MDQKQIEEIVRSVMASMGQTAPAPSEAKCATTNCAAPVTSESCALDLGSAEAKAWIGVENPHRADVLTELRRSTVARVCTGRAGPRPRTQALLRFLADHSRSKDTVLKEVPEEWVKAQGLLEVRSEISDKNLYLTRPDMGRRLCAEAVEALKAHNKSSIPVFGVDALPEALALVKSGALAGTVLNDANNQAKATFDLAKNLADGKGAADGTNWKIDNKVVRVPYVGVDKDNLAEFSKK